MGMETYQKEVEHLGETQGMKDHDHDMVHDLSRRLDMLWRYDQYMANAQGHDELQAFWKEARRKERENIGELKTLITRHVRDDCF